MAISETSQAGVAQNSHSLNVYDGGGDRLVDRRFGDLLVDRRDGDLLGDRRGEGVGDFGSGVSMTVSVYDLESAARRSSMVISFVAKDKKPCRRVVTAVASISVDMAYESSRKCHSRARIESIKWLARSA